MVRLIDVEKRYADVVALHKTSIDVAKGEFITLLGPSGSGKTTLLNMIAGMTRPSAGEVWIAGRNVTDVEPAKRGLGMVFQSYALMPHMTVFDNIAFPLRVRKVARSEIRRRVMEVLELIKLPHVAARKPRELSGGQQQRISLARCIVYNPDLVLMDEPLGALDRKLREHMQVEIKRLHGQLGMTMLYVTHDQEEALTMSDRIILMNGGRIEQIGTPNDLYFQPQTAFAADFIGTSNLLPAEVVDAGHVRTADGTILAIAPSVASAGIKGTVLTRPENCRIGVAADVQPGENRLSGTLVTSMIVGSIIKHVVAVSPDIQMIIQEQTREDAGFQPPGSAVAVIWPARQTRFLVS